MAERAPRRIQRRRTKGWRMPEGAVYVGRPSRFGNHWRAGEIWDQPYVWHVPSAAAAIDQPCHADVLLELANR